MMTRLFGLASLLLLAPGLVFCTSNLQPGSPLCKGFAVLVTNSQGQTYDACTGQVYNKESLVVDGDGGLCEDSADDTTCSTCLKSACCDELRACEEDTDCTCYVNCRASGGTAEGCAGAACASEPDDTYTAMASCFAAGCAQCPGIQ